MLGETQNLARINDNLQLEVVKFKVGSVSQNHAHVTFFKIDWGTAKMGGLEKPTSESLNTRSTQ